MKNKINNIKLFLNLLFSIIIAWAISLQFNPIKNTDWNYLFNTGYSLLFLFGGFIGIYSIYKFKIIGIPKNTLLHLGLALLSYGIGLNVWTYYIYKYQLEVPYPALPDLFFALFYPLSMLSVFSFLKLFSFLIKEETVKNLLKITTVISIIMIFILGTEISLEVTFWENFFNFYYPISSAFILSASILLIKLSGGESTKSAIWLSLGLATHGIAAFFFTIRSSSGTYWNGDFVDILFAISAFLMSLAGINIIKSLIPEESKK